MRWWVVGLCALAGVVWGCSDEAGNEGAGGASANASSSASSDASTNASSNASSSAQSSTSASSGTAGGSAVSFADMCARPEVIFCEDFEGGFGSEWIEDGGDVRIVAGAAVAGEGAEVVELATYQGQGSSKLIYTFAGAEEIYVRFDVQYDAAYDNSGGSHGPILGGSMNPPWGMMGTAGITPSGDDYFVLNFEPIGTVGDGGSLGFYAYFVNMTTTWGTQFESTQSTPPIIEPGGWHCAEYGMQLNTPGDTTDGVARFWVDGQLHGEFGGFTWRTDPALLINAFNLDSYNHFNDGAPPLESANPVRYDNVVVATAPMGCLAR